MEGRKMRIFLSDLLENKGQQIREDFYNNFKQRISVVGDANDIMKCIDYCIVRNRYKLTTSEKRFLVKCVEKCEPNDFKAVLTQSQKTRKRFLTILNLISYTRFSRSIVHSTIIKDVKLGNYITAEKALECAKDSRSVFNTLAQYPVIILEKLQWCIELGVPPEDLLKFCYSFAQYFSTADLLNATTIASKDTSIVGKTVFYVLREMLKKHLAQLTFEHSNNSFVSMNFGDLILEESFINYGLTRALPECARFVRVFLCWKDEVSDSIDLIATKDECVTKNQNIISILGHNTKDTGILQSKDSYGCNGIEWVDVDLEKCNGILSFNAHLYFGRDNFSQVPDCKFGIAKITNLGGEIVSTIHEWEIKLSLIHI